nr:carboxypeptidase-like regulatory domain-containing protein [Acidobacteriota bacterium]
EMKRLWLLLIVIVSCALPGVIRQLAAQDTSTLDGEPAIRFIVGHGHLTNYCEGLLYVTPTRVRFDSFGEPSHSFDLPRAQVSDLHPGRSLGFSYVKIEGGGKTYRMAIYPDLARQFGDRHAFVERAFKDFQGAYAEVQRAEAKRSTPAGLIKAAMTKDGAMLEFPIIVGSGFTWFRGEKVVTAWADSDAGANAYVWIQGPIARGKLEVTADRVRFLSDGVAGDADIVIDAPKKEMRMVRTAGGYPHAVVAFRASGRVTLMFAQFTSEPIGSGKQSGLRKNFYDVTPLLRALGPQFPQLAAELLPQPVLVVAAAPGAEVFVDEQRRGVAGADGTLRITALAPGNHAVRAVLAGRQPGSGTITLAAGEEKRLDIPLAAVVSAPPAAPAKPAGPATLALKDVVAMLEGGVAPRRVAALVQERGVDFALDDAAEKQVRSAGGDAELLVVIAKSKR